MSVTGLPFDDIRELILSLASVDVTASDLACSRSDDLATKFGAFGKQKQLMQWLAAWSGKSPVVNRPLTAIFAGTHKISLKMQDNQRTETTLDQVTRLAAGGAPVNQVCAQNDIGLKVFDLALQYPVEDISVSDALDEKGSAATIGFGMEAISGGVDVLAISAMGQGSFIANVSIIALVTGWNVEEFSDHSDDLKLINQCAQRNAAVKTDPFELLRRLGGREHSAIAGAILAARVSHIPVILDGLSAVVVALLLERYRKGSCDHCLVASTNKGTLASKLADFAGFGNILAEAGSFDDATAGALAIAYLQSVVAIHANSVLDIS